MKRALIIIAVLLVGTAGWFGWQIVSAPDTNTRDNQKAITTDKSEEEKTNDKIFAEVVQQMNLERSRLQYFRIFDQDKVQYSYSGIVYFVYFYEKEWQIAHKGQDLPSCSEFVDIPEQYRPGCYDVESDADKYLTDDGESINYNIDESVDYL